MAVDPIRITLVSGECLEGELYCMDPVTKAIVLKEADGGYSLVNSEGIAQITGDLAAFPVPDPIKTGLTVQLDANKIRDREMTAMVNAEKEIESQNFNVDPKVQQLFDRMRNIFPCVWSGADNHMILFDSLLVEGPSYDVVKVRSGGGSDDGIDRVRKVLKGERKKLRF